METIIPLQDGVSIGQRDHLSEGEIAAAKSMLEGYSNSRCVKPVFENSRLTSAD